MTPDQITAADQASDDACYLALKARDARFDGCFFTGVTSTGIYCRPVCNVKAPKRENCRFFGLAAQAESAGFRPCLRCRPELAPHSVVWSIQDASYILAHQAARLLDEPENWAPTLVASRTSLPPEGAAAPAVWQSQSRGPGLDNLPPRSLASRSPVPPAAALRLRPGPSTGSGQAKASSVTPAGEERSPGVIAGLARRLGISRQCNICRHAGCTPPSNCWPIRNCPSRKSH
jgi:Metal binding domain of Ada